ncbi:MAG: phosphatidate cytidylyltransferase [Paracoccaceae bacterium]
MSDEGRWSDLVQRVISGLVLAGLGLGAVWSGGWVFIWFVAIACGGIMWELVRMLSPGRPEMSAGLGVLTTLCSVLAIWFPAGFALPTLLVPAVLGWLWLKTQRRIFVPFAFFILLAGFGMASVRSEFGFVWMAWLITTVAATDIAGYFAGRIFGGPKFWPKVSPKKTWSGTAAGWVVAALVGLGFAQVLPGGGGLVLLSIAASFASQMGDIAESAVKRHVGVKDSSGLIPGHGGIFDRFDGMLGASVLVLFVMELTGYPPGGV